MDPEKRTRCDELHLVVQVKMAKGRLPSVWPSEVAAGYGENEICDVCDRRIRHHQVLYEVELAGWPMLRFHIACHAAWRMVVTLRRRQQ